MTNKEIISSLRGLIGKYNLTDEEWQTVEKTIEVLSNSDGDCISREQALRIAEQGQVLGYEWQFRELCKLPSIQPKAKWISVSERQPNNSGMYLVSGENKVWICEFLILGGIGGGWVNDALNPTVKVWMPLPESYQEEKKADKEQVKSVMEGFIRFMRAICNNDNLGVPKEMADEFGISEEYRRNEE